MRTHVASEQLDEGWQAITRAWLSRLCDSLGKSYVVAESAHFHFVSALGRKAQDDFLAFLEQTRARIIHQLGDIPLPKFHGKHVILCFSELDDYYRYIAFFFPDGEYATSGGMFLSRGYMHIAYPHQEARGVDRAVLVHEFTHNLLETFRLPTWQNEALAMAFESEIAGSGKQLLTRELAEEHRAYWTSETIQEFWRGSSFSSLDGQKLAYSLAQILLNLVATELRPPTPQFREFVLHAQRKDSGQAAAQDHLGIDLSDLVSTFLGPGDWAPKAELAGTRPHE